MTEVHMQEQPAGKLQRGSGSRDGVSLHVEDGLC